MIVRSHVNLISLSYDFDNGKLAAYQEKVKDVCIVRSLSHQNVCWELWLQTRESVQPTISLSLIRPACLPARNRLVGWHLAFQPFLMCTTHFKMNKIWLDFLADNVVARKDTGDHTWFESTFNSFSSHRCMSKQLPRIRGYQGHNRRMFSFPPETKPIEESCDSGLNIPDAKRYNYYDPSLWAGEGGFSPVSKLKITLIP